MDVVRTKLSVQTGQTIWVGGVVIGLVRSIGLDERGKDAHGAVVIVGKLDDAGHLGKVDVGSRVDLPPAATGIESMVVCGDVVRMHVSIDPGKHVRVMR